MSNVLAHSWKRLVRFAPKSSPSKILIGQPVKDDIDVGLTLRKGKDDVEVEVFSGTSILNPGSPTGSIDKIGRVFSPLTQLEVGTIRCVGLNYKQHAAELNMAHPTDPPLFMKPSTSLNDPWPSPCVIPKISQRDDCSDYEAELAVVLNKTAKNVSEEDAMDYVLGYTAANDVSSRVKQFTQSQWNYSKGFDGACPLGPIIVSPSLIPDPMKLKMRGLLNGEVMQETGVDDSIFSIPKLISFLSDGTTLPAGTVILTGTPSGVGFGRTPKVSVREGDEFHVEIEPYIGTLVSVFENEK